MIALFCLRLAWGVAAALLLLNPKQVNQRYYRVQFLIVLSLLVAASLFLPQPTEAGWPAWLALGSGMVLAFAGSVCWTLDEAPGGRLAVYLTPLAAGGALLLTAGRLFPMLGPLPVAAAELTSAAVIGLSLATMLMGHSYLLAPSMSINPLLRLLSALFGAILLRGLLAGVSLWSWSSDPSLPGSGSVTLLLPVRWLLGVLFPLALGFMAWQAARIRSTQSATGILYAVVFLCFVGELTGQLLLTATHLPL